MSELYMRKQIRKTMFIFYRTPRIEIYNCSLLFRPIETTPFELLFTSYPVRHEIQFRIKFVLANADENSTKSPE